MNVIVVTGNLGQDAELIKVGDKQVVKFSIASRERDKTIWFRCDWWTAADLTKYMKKGQDVRVSGRIDETEKDGRKYQTIVVQSFELGPKHQTTEQQTNDLPY